MAQERHTIVEHRSGGEGAQTQEPGLPDYGAAQPSGGGGFMAWVSEHKLLVTVVLGGAGVLLLIYFYNQGQAGSSPDTSIPGDTSGSTGVADPSSGLGTSGYGAPDWSPVIGALSGLQTTDSSILAQLQSTQAAQASGQAVQQDAPPTAGSTSWQPQPLGNTPGLSSSQEADKQRSGCISYHTNHECKGLKGGKRQECINHWTSKCGARHPAQGGAFSPGSSLGLRSMHMSEPHWRSGDHQGIHLGRMN